MSHHFKPGDLALIVSGNTRSPNVGRTVRLVECLGSPEIYQWDGDTYLNSTLGLVWIIEVDGEPLETRFTTPATRGPICEYKLMPLRGAFAPLQSNHQAVPA